MAYEVQRIRMEPQATAVVCGQVPVDGIREFLSGVFREVMGLLGHQSVAPCGPPFARYRLVPGESAGASDEVPSGEVPSGGGQQGAAAFDVEAGFPVAGPIVPAGRVEASSLPGGETILVMHRGPYEHVHLALAAAEQWLAENEWESTGAPWQAHLDGPEVAQPRTIVHVPVRPT